MVSLEEHLIEEYDVDVEEQIHLVKGLDEWGPPPAGAIEPPSRFVIDDENKANWALRKMAQIDARRVEIAEQANRERERIDAWEKRVMDPLDRDLMFFSGLLTEFHRAQLEADPDRKTIDLPAGKLFSRAGQQKWLVDNDAFLEWARENAPNLIRQKEEPDKTALKKAFSVNMGDVSGAAVSEDGEIVPGIEVTPANTSFWTEVG